MEAAIRGLLESTFGEFVEGLDRASAGSFPMTLKDLKLKEARIQEELDEDGNFPFDLTSGRIGQIKVSPGWMGDVEVVATGVVLNFTFSPMKAMNNAFRKDEPDDDEEEQTMGMLPGGPMGHPGMQMQQDVPPRFCQKHGTSAQREKIDPVQRPCQRCGAQITSTYATMTYCPPCSNSEERCMMCGDPAPLAGNYIPPKTLGQQGPPQAGMIFARPAEDMPGRPPAPPRRPGGGEAYLPSPPPPAPRRGPSRPDFDVDAMLGGNSPGQAPPSPPPPPSNRNQGTCAAAPPHPGEMSRGGPPPMPCGTRRQEQATRTSLASPDRDPMRSQRPRHQAHFAPSADVERGPTEKYEKSGAWQMMYSGATDGLDQVLDYLGTLQLPTIDISQWSTCLAVGDPAAEELREAGASPRRPQRHMQRA